MQLGLRDWHNSVMAFSEVSSRVSSGGVRVSCGTFSGTFMVQWFARREDISMKIFTDNPLQGLRTEFVIAKLWCSSKETIFTAARKKTQLCCGQCTPYPDIRMKFANDR